MHRPYYRLHVCVQLNKLFPNIIVHLLWKKIVDKGCVCGKTLFNKNTKIFACVSERDVVPATAGEHGAA